MLRLDPSIPGRKGASSCERFSGRSCASPENDGADYNGRQAASSHSFASPATSGESFSQTLAW